MTNILCFGDSNTFGTNPHGGRHPYNVRWTGRLQRLLGPDYYVIEEGMGGRTTVWDDPLEPDRCGAAALPLALQSHKPLDLVIIALGTNDCKALFHVTPKIVAKGVERLCKIVRGFDFGPGYPLPKILLISPIHIREGIEHSPYPMFDASAPEISRGAARYIRKVAEQQGCLFLDASEIAEASTLDCLHMEAAGHAALAERIASIVRDELS